MSLDVKVKNAIESAVQDANQPTSVANRLIAWFEAINDGNEDLNDMAQVNQRLEILYDGTEVKVSDPVDKILGF